MAHLEATAPLLHRPVPELPDGVLEREPSLPTIKIMYCDNDLFRNHMTEVQQHLESLGRRVEVTVFENEAAIRDDFKDSAERAKLSHSELFLDVTTGATLMDLTQLADEPNHDYHELDSFFNTVYTRATLGEEKWPQYKEAIDQADKNMDAAHTVFTTIIERTIEHIIEQGGQPPDQIHLLLEDIFEHGPFKNHPEIQQHERTRMLALMAALTENPELDTTEFLDHYPPFQPSTELLAAVGKNITTWLTDAGINSATVEVLPTMPTDSLDSLDEPNHWVISDRHVKRHHNTVHFEQAKWLQLPIESFFASAVDNKLLPQPANLSGLMQQTLEQTFVRSDQAELYH